jgi:RNA polymerase sigma-70 factor (ECF subfamily)
VNREVFQSLIAPEIAPLHRFLRRIGVREADLDDVAQEVLIAVGMRLSEYDPTRPVRPWLFAFATRVAASWRRSARSTRESLSATAQDAQSDGAMNAHEWIESKQRRQLVIDSLQELDDEQRVVFVLIELESMSAPEVAAALGVNLNTVYSRLRLARATFTAAVRRLSLQRGAL